MIGFFVFIKLVEFTFAVACVCVVGFADFLNIFFSTLVQNAKIGLLKDQNACYIDKSLWGGGEGDVQFSFHVHFMSQIFTKWEWEWEWELR